MGSVSVIRDGVGIAHMGHPFALYLSLGICLSRWIDSGSLLVSPGGDPSLGPFQVPPRKAEGRLRVVAPCFSCPACGSGGPYLGHVLSDQVPFRQAGCVPSVMAHPVISHPY